MPRALTPLLLIVLAAVGALGVTSSHGASPVVDVSEENAS